MSTGGAAGPVHSGIAPAKVNLTLSVTGRREDGFHGLESLFLAVSLADRLSVRVVSGDGSHGDARDDLVIAGPEPCPVDGNLVLRAARLIRDHVARPLPRLHFELDKRVPVAAGLGGGSSDGALALRLAVDAWGLWDAHPPLPLLRLAEQLGSDVPFFLHESALALVGGRGEVVEPLPAPSGDLGVLLVTPATRLATRDVFAAYDDLFGVASATHALLATAAAVAAPAADATRMLTGRARGAWTTRDLLDAAPHLRDANDLWPAAAALAPDLVQLREDLEQRLACPVMLSGSGPTFFALLPSLFAAEAARGALLSSPGRLPPGTVTAAEPATTHQDGGLR